MSTQVENEILNQPAPNQPVPNQSDPKPMDLLIKSQQEMISKLQIDKQIIIYNNRIYITHVPHKTIIWLYDYFYYRTVNRELSVNSDNPEFYIELTKKQFINPGISHDDTYKNTLYYGFLNTVKIIEDASEDNICKIHTDILKSRLENNVVSTVKKEDIISRELSHRRFIIKQIDSLFIKVPAHLYKMTGDGRQTVKLSFAHINEKEITNNGALPYFKSHPCSDNIIRKDFRDYFNFLLEKEFLHKSDELDKQDWIGERLVNKCKKIYPHLDVTYNTTANLLPDININLNIDIINMLL